MERVKCRKRVGSSAVSLSVPSPCAYRFQSSHKNTANHKYAVDFKLYISGLVSSLDWLLQWVPKNIESMIRWTWENRLALNPGKTQAIIFESSSSPHIEKLQHHQLLVLTVCVFPFSIVSMTSGYMLIVLLRGGTRCFRYVGKHSGPFRNKIEIRVHCLSPLVSFWLKASRLCERTAQKVSTDRKCKLQRSSTVKSARFFNKSTFTLKNSASR